MRWYIKDQPDYKIVKRFLFFPIRLQDERRWMETAYIYVGAVKLTGEWMYRNFVTESDYLFYKRFGCIDEDRLNIRSINSLNDSYLDKSFDDLINNLDTSEPTEMRQIREGFNFDLRAMENKKEGK